MNMAKGVLVGMLALLGLGLAGSPMVNAGGGTMVLAAEHLRSPDDEVHSDLLVVAGLGLQINELWAMEGRLGLSAREVLAEDDNSTTPSGYPVGLADLLARLTFPVNSEFKPYVLGGWQSVLLSVRECQTVTVGGLESGFRWVEECSSGHQTQSAPVLGGGVAWYLGQQSWLSLEARHMQRDDLIFNSISLGLQLQLW